MSACDCVSKAAWKSHTAGRRWH